MHTASLHEHQSSIDTVILYGTYDSCKKFIFLLKLHRTFAKQGFKFFHRYR